jgi:hypothetical protein
MKTAVRLAVLLSILLFGTGAAFAALSCTGIGSTQVSDMCYEMAVNQIDNPLALTNTSLIEIVLCANGRGFFFDVGGNPLFWFSPPGAFAFSKQVMALDDTCSLYLKFHGHNDDDFTGISYCTINNLRYTVKGHSFPCP